MPKIKGVDVSGLPIGVPVPCSSTQCPPKTLLCDGETYNIADYPYLYAKIGTTYGGDGVTTFQVPDIRGRSVMAMDDMMPAGSTRGAAGITTNGNADIVGGVFGAQNHILTPGEMPVHNHDARVRELSTGQGSGAGTVGFSVTTNTEILGDTGNRGGGGSHNNLQPNFAQPWVIAYE